MAACRQTRIRGFCILTTQSCCCQQGGKQAAAGVQYEKAAQYEGYNVDYVGQCGQMFYYLKNFTKAYQYLGKAVQLPGGDKYKSSFDGIREYLQNQQQQQLIREQNKKKPGGGGPNKKPGPKKNDDDDD